MLRYGVTVLPAARYERIVREGWGRVYPPLSYCPLILATKHVTSQTDFLVLVLRGTTQ